jgi:hypothetical protein
MKKYICLNHGECIWADEKPPREFSLPEIDENVCPNCGSSNIKEKPAPPGPPWKKIAAVVGLLLLILGIVWLFIPPDPPPLVPLTIQAESNCQTRLITLISTGGDGSPITFTVEGLNSVQDSVFKIPINQPAGSTFTFHAVQSGKTVSFQYRINCKPLKFSPGPVDNPGKTTESVSPKWNRVAGSEFCVGDCIVAYSEIDNLGHTRERRVENYDKCCPANK